MSDNNQGCPECGSTNLRWHTGTERGMSILFAGCEYCSETISVISLEEAADLLTKYSKQEHES